MREIKFRAWLKGRMVYITPDDDYFIDGDGRLVKIEQSENGCNYQGFEGFECNLMQYTGLKDKDDREIYEGDIVRVHEGEDFIWTEQVIENSGGYWVDENYLGAIHSFCEVIGNIYEHNHLLEESQNGTK